MNINVVFGEIIPELTLSLGMNLPQTLTLGTETPQIIELNVASPQSIVLKSAPATIPIELQDILRGQDGTNALPAGGTQGQILYKPDGINGSGAWANLYYDSLTLTLALRSGGASGDPSPNKFYVYNYINGANYERGAFKWLNNDLIIGAEKSGDGSARKLIVRDGFYQLYFNGAQMSFRTAADSAFVDVRANQFLDVNNRSVDVRDEVVQDITATTSSLVIDYTQGSTVKLTLASDITSFVVNGWPAAGFVGRLVLDVTNTGSFSINAWPAGSRAQGGIAPTVAPINGAESTIVLRTVDGGVKIKVDGVADNYTPI